VGALSPYRIAAARIEAFAPAVAWTRWAALALATASLVVPTLVIRDLLADEDCKHISTPHPWPALLVLVIAVATTWPGLFLQRRWAAWLRDHVLVRSRIIGALYALATLIPSVSFGVVAYVLSAWIDFAYTWDLCLEMDWSAFARVLGFGC
jgi:hypothetical protein